MFLKSVKIQNTLLYLSPWLRNKIIWTRLILFIITSLRKYPPSVAFLRGTIIQNSTFIIPMHVCIFTVYVCISEQFIIEHIWKILYSLILRSSPQIGLGNCLLSPNQCLVLFTYLPTVLSIRLPWILLFSIASREIFIRHLSDHVTPWLKTLQWFPTKWNSHCFTWSVILPFPPQCYPRVSLPPTHYASTLAFF